MNAIALLDTTALHIRELRRLGQRMLRTARFEARECSGSQAHRDHWARTYRDLARDAFVKAARVVKDERRRFEGLDRLRFA